MNVRRTWWFGLTSLTWGMVLRMLADAIMINFALALALALRFSYEVLTLQNTDNTHGLLQYYIRAYYWNAPFLSILALMVYLFSGFYTYGRSYQGKYKVLVITQAVSLVFLVFGLLTYMLQDRLWWHELPRGALIMSYLLTYLMCLASRTWTFLWEHIVQSEKERNLRRKHRHGRNVLVIGGAGYIGSALIPMLLQRGYRVRILDLFLYGREPLASVEGHPSLELIEGDFRQVDKVVTAMQGMDAVIHLGAIVGDPACDLDQQITIDVNLSATQMIAQIAKAYGISKFIFASTCSVYGATDEILDECSEVRPISLYGATKLAAERGLQQIADRHFQPTVMRFATIYGFSGRTRFDLVVNLLAAKAKCEGVITVHGGDQWRPFIHVEDAALALLKIIEAPLHLVGNQIFNVGSNDQNYTIAQVGQLIHEQVVGSRLICDPQTTDRRNYRVDFSKLQRTLNFKPRWTLQQGISQVLEALADGQIADYRDPRFSNVRHLTANGAIEIIRSEEDWVRYLPEIQRNGDGSVSPGSSPADAPSEKRTARLTAASK